jgi:hypothetical protein
MSTVEEKVITILLFSTLSIIMLFIFKQIYSFNIFQPVSEKQRYSKNKLPFLIETPILHQAELA